VEVRMQIVPCFFLPKDFGLAVDMPTLSGGKSRSCFAHAEQFEENAKRATSRSGRRC
jgi:hypothetical protein